MLWDQTNQESNAISLDTARERRRFIDLANANENWRQTVASFALSDITPTDDDAERAGRLIAGAITLEQVYTEIRRKAGATCREN